MKLDPTQQPTLSLEILPEQLAVARLSPSESVPAWAFRGPFFSVSRTNDELSVVCLQTDVPSGITVETNWRAFKVKGPLDFGLTGILASIAQPLAAAKVSIFAVSTFDTDYVLVKNENLESAIVIRPDNFIFTVPLTSTFELSNILY